MLTVGTSLLQVEKLHVATKLTARANHVANGSANYACLRKNFIYIFWRAMARVCLGRNGLSVSRISRLGGDMYVYEVVLLAVWVELEVHSRYNA